MDHTQYSTDIMKRKVVKAAAAATAILILAAVLVNLFGICWAEESTTTMWVLCKPEDNPRNYVHVRRGPGRKYESLGRFVNGDRVEVDGTTKDGFAHVIHVALEEDEGWIHAGYLVDEEPLDAKGMVYEICSNGRVACRKNVDGTRIGWVVDGSQVRVWGYTSEWAVTNKGFIQTKYIGGL